MRITVYFLFVIFLVLQTEATLSTSNTYAYYELIDLGNFGGIESVPRGINESGQVIVTVIPPRGSGTHTRAVIWENGTSTDLGTLGGAGDTMAYGLNDLGQVVGHSQTSNGSTHGFLWENGAMTDLGAIGNDFSRAYGINNNSQITGWTQIDNPPDPRGRDRAFMWENGTMTALGTLGGWVSYGYSINDFGQVTGYSYNSSGQVHGFFWENSVMTDIGNIVGTFVSINNSGQIVGFLLVNFTAFARYSGGDGSPENPFQIATPNDLNSVGNHPEDWNKHFIPTADINMADYTYKTTLIAKDQDSGINFNGTEFTGLFDGNDHTISNLGLYGVIL